MKNPYLDINTPNIRRTLADLVKMRALSRVVRVDGLDVDENGQFTTCRIYFRDQGSMQAYINGVQATRG